MHPARLSWIGAALLLAGAVALVALVIRQNRDRWVPLTVGVPLTSGQSAEGTLEAAIDGFYELQFEIDAVVARDDLERYVTVRSEPSRLNVRWQVRSDGRRVAGGDCAGYTYVDPPPKDRLRTLYRALLRSPYGVSPALVRSFGLAGPTTAARGVGRFRAVQGRAYAIEVTAGADHASLFAGAPRMVLRPDRRLWQANWATVETLGYFGYGSVAMGLLLLAVSLLWRRFGPAPRGESR